MASTGPDTRPHLHLMADMGFADTFQQRLEDLGLAHRNNVVLVGKKPENRLASGHFSYTDLTEGSAPDPRAFGHIFVHFMLPMVCHWLHRHPDVRVHWVFYGAEVYRNPLVTYSGLLPKTAGYARWRPSEAVRRLGYHLVHRKAWQHALSRVDQVLMGNPEEFDLIQSLVPSMRARFEPFFYGKALRDVQHLESNPLAAAFGDEPLHIQLGHCACPSVNHLDLLESASATHGVIWHVPLSYGDPRYALWLQRRCRNRKNLRWMMDRLPIEQYMNHQSHMSAAVFPNVRQQALANINSYLMQGKPVFLHPENPTYRYYVEQGIQLGSTTNFSEREVRRLAKKGEENQAQMQRLASEDSCNANYLRLFS